MKVNAIKRKHIISLILLVCSIIGIVSAETEIQENHFNEDEYYIIQGTTVDIMSIINYPTQDVLQNGKSKYRFSHSVNTPYQDLLQDRITASRD